jgi:hypothetical protein
VQSVRVEAIVVRLICMATRHPRMWERQRPSGAPRSGELLLLGLKVIKGNHFSIASKPYFTVSEHYALVSDKHVPR